MKCISRIGSKTSVPPLSVNFPDFCQNRRGGHLKRFEILGPKFLILDHPDVTNDKILTPQLWVWPPPVASEFFRSFALRIRDFIVLGDQNPIFRRPPRAAPARSPQPSSQNIGGGHLRRGGTLILNSTDGIGSKLVKARSILAPFRTSF